MLVDVFGATPCKAARAVVDGVRQRIVTGVNVPMLWRALCYAAKPLDELVTRAVDGGIAGHHAGRRVPTAEPGREARNR